MIFYPWNNYKPYRFAPSTIGNPAWSTHWLYDLLATTWQNHGWINAAAANTVRAGGYYTQLIRPGFRLVVLNNNDCYIYNWWVMYSRTEIAGALVRQQKKMSNFPCDATT